MRARYANVSSPSSISFCCRSMNSLVLSMPRWLSTKLRTAASTSTARLRPAATGIVTLRIGHRQHVLVSRVDLQAVELGEGFVAVILEMHEELQELARAHRGLAEDRADVEHADAADFEEVAQHRGAAALDRIGRDAEELDDVVGDEAVAARDELQRQLALADGGGAGDEHAHLQHVQEDAVQRRRFGQHAREVSRITSTTCGDGCGEVNSANVVPVALIEKILRAPPRRWRRGLPRALS